VRVQLGAEYVQPVGQAAAVAGFGSNSAPAKAKAKASAAASHALAHRLEIPCNVTLSVCVRHAAKTF
jgi:hypothetical protein